MFFVYMLSLDNGLYYIGYTKNFLKRLSEHENKKSKYTSKYKIIGGKIIAILPNRKAAMYMEKYFKKFSHDEKKDLYNNVNYN